MGSLPVGRPFRKVGKHGSARQEDRSLRLAWLVGGRESGGPAAGRLGPSHCCLGLPVAAGHARFMVMGSDQEPVSNINLFPGLLPFRLLPSNYEVTGSAARGRTAGLGGTVASQLWAGIHVRIRDTECPSKLDWTDQRIPAGLPRLSTSPTGMRRSGIQAAPSLPRWCASVPVACRPHRRLPAGPAKRREMGPMLVVEEVGKWCGLVLRTGKRPACSVPPIRCESEPVPALRYEVNARFNEYRLPNS